MRVENKHGAARRARRSYSDLLFNTDVITFHTNITAGIPFGDR